MIKNKKALVMRRLCNEYKMNRNNGIAYEEFHLTEEMKWKECNVGEQIIKYDKLVTIFLPEFMNRYAFVSSFAWLINSFHGMKGVTRRHAMELLYVALLTPSQIQFQRVVQHLRKTFQPRNNLCFEYIKHCKKYRLCANGGPSPRFMVGKETELPRDIVEIKQNIKRIEHAIECLNNGNMMNESGVFTDNKTVVNVKGIGAARAISFPSLCCFTGLGTSWKAFQTAKQAILNSTGNGYAGDRPNELSKLGQILRVDGDSPPYNNSYYHSILEAAGKSVGEVQSTMENAACAITRTHKKEDMFVKGQSLYYLFLDCKALEEVGVVVNDDSQIETTVYEKKTETKKWTKAQSEQIGNSSSSHTTKHVQKLSHVP